LMRDTHANKKLSEPESKSKGRLYRAFCMESPSPRKLPSSSAERPTKSGNVIWHLPLLL
jgi:hypothetical protein